jgi:hypothetical protein
MTQIDRYVSHLSCCSSLVCGQCREAKESDIHYSGTVDSHVFQPTETCDCGLEAELAEIHRLERWKAEAMESLARWHALGDELQKQHPLPLGVDVPSALREIIGRR